MNREINPNLFGFPQDLEKLGGQLPLQPTALSAVDLIHQTSAERPGGYLPLEIRAVETQVQTARAQMNAVEQKLEGMGVHMQEFARAVNLRMERLTSAIKRLEEAQSAQFQELSGKNAILAGKVNERKVNDDKILNLIERHGILVRNFENRLVTLQRTLSEQELQLHASNAALEEARQEISKIRR